MKKGHTKFSKTHLIATHQKTNFMTSNSQLSLHIRYIMWKTNKKSRFRKIRRNICIPFN